MSKKKTKKLRSSNYAAAGLVGTPAASRGGGAETLAQPVPVRGETRNLFDYTHVKHDMRRIGLLAGGCVAVLVILSFIIR
jgi:hypothetical protein